VTFIFLNGAARKKIIKFERSVTARKICDIRFLNGAARK